MTLNVSMVTEQPHQPKITVVGVGGGGGNAVKNMIEAQLQGVNFVVANTDLQALEQSPAEKSIRIGMNITEGLGAGANPEVGAAAAEESFDDIAEAIRGSHMVFITAGMGGGTGTGGAPVVARIAKEQGILTVAVVTKPFGFEGSRRMKLAESGIEELQQYADTVIIIPNQNLFRIATERTTLMEAFKMADDVLYKGVRGVTDLMINPGLINLDFNDIKTVMSEMGQAMMGTGQAEGERRAIMAAEMAISSPLLDGISMTGARGVLINITGGMDMTLYEVDEAANRIREEVDPDANIIYGQVIDQEMEGQVRVSVVATGIGASKSRQNQGFDISNAGFGGSSSYGASSYGSSFSSSAATSAATKSAPVMPAAEPKQATSTVVSENSIEAKLSSAPQTTEAPKTSNVSEPQQSQETEQEADFDDLEIPAFLRRQAN